MNPLYATILIIPLLFSKEENHHTHMVHDYQGC